MKEYEGFIRGIKEYQGKADYDRMYARIEQRIFRRRTGMRLALAGALALILFAFAVYFYYPLGQASKGETLLSYVFERESVDGPLLDYVLDANGTF